ncbi:hypothetical protein BBJ29_006025 [Phytophthora kernoviae]|uniref:Beta-lactamase-related domain-containing protein n=1 Tax=Phytophthora kernoviae TaxID=325452 RepID=A0A3F2RH32_9STRA|nr:hypothetical protein BBJ29_006025 [Phytophthora kernoviae]RLN56779.1 hypothetical protein BBP00_00007815 [Phytophthora kernoviae]
MHDEQLPLVSRDGAGDSLQQQLSSYHQRQRARQKRRDRTRTVGRATVGFLAAALLALLLIALSWPAQRRNERAVELTTLLDAYKQAKNFSGVVRLSHNGQKKLQVAMGKANVPLNDPMKEHSVFPMGAHVQLDWEAFGFGAGNQTTWCLRVGDAAECEQMTFQQLLYMGSGIESEETLRRRPLYALGSLGRQIGSFINAPLAFKPGTNYSYSDDNYVLLAYMVESLSGLSFGEYLQTHIFKPLNLKFTSYDPYVGALGVQKGLVDEYVQYYAHREPNVTASDSESSSGSGAVIEKRMHHMATGTCQLYQDLGSSVQGLQSTGKDMHRLYTDLFHDHGHHSKLLKTKSISQIVSIRNPVYPAFAQGIGVDFEGDQSGEETVGVKDKAWPSKIAFCGSTACSTTCMTMQTPSTNMSIIASAFTNDVRLLFPSVDAFHAYKPREFLEKREPTMKEDGFEKNDGEVNTLAWSLLQVFLRFYTNPSN